MAATTGITHRESFKVLPCASAEGPRGQLLQVRQRKKRSDYDWKDQWRPPPASSTASLLKCCLASAGGPRGRLRQVRQRNKNEAMMLGETSVSPVAATTGIIHREFLFKCCLTYCCASAGGPRGRLRQVRQRNENEATMIGETSGGHHRHHLTSSLLKLDVIYWRLKIVQPRPINNH